MPRRQSRQLPPMERAKEEIRDEIERFSDLIAADFGPAPGARRISDEKKIELWGQADPVVHADSAGFQQALMQGGLPPELLDPNSKDALAIIQAIPEIAQVYSQPLDETMADYMTKLAEYPNRLVLLSELEDDPEGQVKEAERLDRLWQRRMGYGDADSQMADAGPVQGAAPLPTGQQPATVGQPPGQPGPVPVDPYRMVGG